jgi:hypothetical protein
VLALEQRGDAADAGEPIRTPKRSASIFPVSRPASVTAMAAEAIAYWR